MTLFDTFLFIGEGVGLTLLLTFAGLAIGALLGAGLAILRTAGVGAWFIARFISLIRGTPLLLQLSFFYFAIPGLLGIKLSVIGAGVIAFGLNSSAYMAEILRAGIESIPRGQFEAARTLRIPKFLMWKDILLPQVLRNVLPALIGEVISLLKETALISTLGGMDILRRSSAVAAVEFTYFGPLCIAGLYYYLLVLAVEYAGRKLEQGAWYAHRA